MGISSGIDAHPFFANVQPHTAGDQQGSSKSSNGRPSRPSVRGRPTQGSSKVLNLNVSNRKMFPNVSECFQAEAGNIMLPGRKQCFRMFFHCRFPSSTNRQQRAFSSSNTINRAIRLIHSRLKAYSKACKDFCNERHYTKRKNKLPLALSECKIIEVQPNGQFKIHEAITSYTYLITTQ